MCAHSLLELEQVVLVYLGVNASTRICACAAMNLRESERVHGGFGRRREKEGNDIMIISNI